MSGSDFGGDVDVDSSTFQLPPVDFDSILDLVIECCGNALQFARVDRDHQAVGFGALGLSSFRRELHLCSNGRALIRCYSPLAKFNPTQGASASKTR